MFGELYFGDLNVTCMHFFRLLVNGNGTKVEKISVVFVIRRLKDVALIAECLAMNVRL